MKDCFLLLLTWFEFSAEQGGVARQSKWTRANGTMIDCLTNGIDTTTVYTRVTATLIEASLVARTIGIYHALGVEANRLPVDQLTLAVVVAR